MRYCGACKLNVYNLSDMDREEAARLVAQAEGRLCVRFYQRRDGTVLTRDCPVGVRAIRKRLAYALSCTVVMFLSVCAFAMRPGRSAAAGEEEGQTISWLHNAEARARQIEPFKSVLNWLVPPKPVVVGAMPAPRPLMGEIAAPPVMGKIAAPTHTGPDSGSGAH